MKPPADRGSPPAGAPVMDVVAAGVPAGTGDGTEGVTSGERSPLRWAPAAFLAGDFADFLAGDDFSRLRLEPPDPGFRERLRQRLWCMQRRARSGDPPRAC